MKRGGGTYPYSGPSFGSLGCCLSGAISCGSILGIMAMVSKTGKEGRKDKYLFSVLLATIFLSLIAFFASIVAAEDNFSAAPDYSVYSRER